MCKIFLSGVVGLLVLGIGANANADACGRQDTLRDSLEVARRIKEFSQAGLDWTKRDHPSFDRKLLIVDRNGIEIKQTGAKGEEIVTQLKDFDSSGVISDYRYENESKTYYNYGTAVLLSSCHVITNRHVVTNKGTRKVSAGHQMFFNVGQASCNSQNHFREQNRSARLVAMGSYEKKIVNDWAILKLDQPSQVQFVPKMTDKATMRGERLVMVGYPGDTADRDRDEAGKSIGFTRPRALFMLAEKNYGGAIDTNFSNDGHSTEGGSSGSGVVRIGRDVVTQKPVLLLKGIQQGEGQYLGFSAISEEMEISKPGLWAEIMKARETGTCQ